MNAEQRMLVKDYGRTVEMDWDSVIYNAKHVGKVDAECLTSLKVQKNGYGMKLMISGVILALIRLLKNRANV